MVNATFLPSQVRAIFSNSTFQKYEKELAAVHIVLYLAHHGDSWDTKIPLREFLDFTTTVKTPFPGDQNPFGDQFKKPMFEAGMNLFSVEGFIAWESEESQNFQVTQKLVDFYSSYAQ